MSYEDRFWMGFSSIIVGCMAVLSALTLVLR